MYLTGDDGYQNFLFFSAMVSSLISNSNKKVAKWTPTRILSKKIKPFDAIIQLTMSNLANGWVILKLNNSVLVQKKFFFIV